MGGWKKKKKNEMVMQIKVPSRHAGNETTGPKKGRPAQNQVEGSGKMSKNKKTVNRPNQEKHVMENGKM